MDELNKIDICLNEGKICVKDIAALELETPAYQPNSVSGLSDAERKRLGKRSSRTTKKQYEELLAFVEKHKIIIKPQNASEALDITKLWKEFANYINRTGYGPAKTVQQWRRIFIEWKGNTRRKCYKIIRNICNTVEEDLYRKTLTHTEVRLLNLLSPKYLEGIDVGDISNKHISEKGGGENINREENTDLLENKKCMHDEIRVGEESPEKKINNLATGMHNNRRLFKTTNKQYEALLEFIEKHKILIKARRTRPENVINKKLWKQFAYYINGTGFGPVKTAIQWQKIFNQWKINTKRKNREIKLNICKTAGENPTKRNKLTHIEEKLLKFLQQTQSEDTTVENAFAQTSNPDERDSFNQEEYYNVDNTTIKEEEIDIKQEILIHDEHHFTADKEDINQEDNNYLKKHAIYIKEETGSFECETSVDDTSDSVTGTRKKRLSRTTRKQYEALLEFIEKHEIILKQKKNRAEIFTVMELWKDFAHYMNGTDYGLKKTAEQWQKVFSDWKINTRRKCQEIKSNACKTDENEPKKTLTDVEVKLLKLLSKAHLEECNSEETSDSDVIEIGAKTRRLPRTTKKQHELMLDFAEKHHIILLGKISPCERNSIKSLWNEFADYINGTGYGPEKTGEQWQNVFKEWKVNARRKSREIKKNICSTSNGRPCTKTLTDVEERFLNLLSKVDIGYCNEYE